MSTDTPTLPDAWKRLAKPFPNDAYRDISFGSRKFTTIDAYHVIERLTEVFGLCGKGWGFGPCPNTPMITESKSDKAHTVAVTLEFWWSDGERHAFVVTGDGAVIRGNVAEAIKKATTNAISKAASYLGCGLSVYQGKGIDDPYIDRAESDGGRVAASSKAPGMPVGDTLTEDEIDAVVAECKERHITGKEIKTKLTESPWCVDMAGVKSLRDALQRVLRVHLRKLQLWMRGEDVAEPGLGIEETA